MSFKAFKQIGQNAQAFCPMKRNKPDQLTQAGHAPVPQAGDGASTGFDPLFLKSVA
jgi:hypothetical protein